MGSSASRGVTHVDVAVVGGGIAGLIAASEVAHNDRSVTLLEADGRVGGRVLSVRRGEYWVNLGAQYTEGEGPFIEAMDRFRIPRGSLVGSHAALAWAGRVVATDDPKKLILGSRLPLRARVDLARLGLHLRRTFRRVAANPDPEDARSFREQLDEQSAWHLAADARSTEVREIFKGLVRHWMATEPDEISAGHCVLNIGSALVEPAEVPNFSLPVGGNQVLTDALGTELGDRVVLRAKVSSILDTNNAVEVRYESERGPRTVIAKQCVVAVRADTVLRLVQQLEWPQRRALEAVNYGQYVVAGIFTHEHGPQPWDNLYAIATPDLPFQVIYNHAAALRGNGTRAPGGAFIAYAGGRPARDLLTASDAEIVGLYIPALDRVFPGLSRMVDDVIVHRWPKAIPFWHPGERLSSRLLRQPMGAIHFAGDYLAYPGLSHAAQAGHGAARAALEALAA